MWRDRRQEGGKQQYIIAMRDYVNIQCRESIN